MEVTGPQIDFGVRQTKLGITSVEADEDALSDSGLIAGIFDEIESETEFENEQPSMTTYVSNGISPLSPVLGIAIVEQLSPEVFKRFRNKRPFVVRNYAKDWKAIDSWMDRNYFSSLADASNVLLLQSPDNRHFIKRDCSQITALFSFACNQIFRQSTNRFYARARLSDRLEEDANVQQLQKDIFDDIRCQEFKRDNCGVWFGTPGNITPLHYDLCHGFLVQVVGRKRFTYFHPDDFRCIYQRDDTPELSKVTLDLWHQESVDGVKEREKYPNFRYATPFTIEVVPGDLIYTPPFWWHHVETGLDQAVSVLLPFDPAADEQPHIEHWTK